MNTRLVRFVLLAAFALLGTGADCGRHHWNLSLLLSTHTAFVGHEFTALVTAEPNPAVGYSFEINWGDTYELLNEEPRPDTFAVSHRWDSAGVYEIHASGRTSAGWWPVFSPAPETVIVLVGGPHAPVVDSVLAPLIAVRGESTGFTVYAYDPDGDSIRIRARWNDTTDTTTGPFADPCTVHLSHTFVMAETVRVVFIAMDRRGAVSKPDTVSVIVGSPGRISGYPVDADGRAYGGGSR